MTETTNQPAGPTGPAAWRYGTGHEHRVAFWCPTCRRCWHYPAGKYERIPKTIRKRECPPCATTPTQEADNVQSPTQPLTADRPVWSRMRRQDFDAAEPLTLFDAPPAPLPAGGDDLLGMIEEEGRPGAERPARRVVPPLRGNDQEGGAGEALVSRG